MFFLFKLRKLDSQLIKLFGSFSYFILLFFYSNLCVDKFLSCKMHVFLIIFLNPLLKLIFSVFILLKPISIICVPHIELLIILVKSFHFLSHGFHAVFEFFPKVGQTKRFKLSDFSISVGTCIN